MSVGFRAVQWNRAKFVYDGILIAGVALYIGAFIAISAWIDPPEELPDWIDLRLRAFGTCAFLMLTIILSIGPLTRLDRRFLPLLYNRRHFGVLTFLVAVVHAWSMVEWFAVQNALPDLVTELTTASHYARFIGFPFKALGLAALLVLFLLAATSHDFWLFFLTPPVWKGLHMLIYPAYAVLAMHVALGAMQDNRSPLVPILLGSAFAWVAALHLIAGRRERTADRGSAPADGWIAVGPPQSIPDKAARIVAAPGGERIAVFRDGGRVGALTNLCAHQNGPLGEGRIIDGCVTCPWHGFQYRLVDGRAPPPFTEVLVTYPVRLRNGIVEVDPRPLPPGTPAAISVDVG
ncbi:MAG TPA: Rieske 2Fe-2S domain-containing protein [Xanthobacteraceae bacterium]|nr:Rieske 2Fe-2S domain-containing protein [Xanthobacteraceae bacterium]